MIFENFRRLTGAAVLAVGIGISGAAHATTIAVDTVLSLLIDVSGSVDATEYGLQKNGYVNAFNDAAVAAAITNTGTTEAPRVGRIAVNVIQFASSAVESIQMTIVGNGGITSSAFSTVLAGLTRPSSGAVGGLTGIGNGITLAESTINAWLAGNTATRKVIDVSGDGNNNTGTAPLTASATFCSAASGGVINGIAIGGGSSLKTYYENNVRCGGGFVLQAATFADFDQAIKTKLAAEISGVDPNVIPLPAGAWLMLGGLGALAAVRRRRKAA